jgi:hypothetical protein
MYVVRSASEIKGSKPFNCSVNLRQASVTSLAINY